MDFASPISSPPNPPPKYRVLVISADPEVCAAAKAAWNPSDEVFCVSDGKSGMTLFQQQTPGLVILDDTLPGENVLKRFETLRTSNPDVLIIVVCSYPTVTTALALMHAGADDFLTKPFTKEHLCSAIDRAVSRKMLEGKILANFEAAIVATGAMKEIVNAAKRAAETNVTVLIEGESGTGKEVFARSIHHWSSRAGLPFVAVSCGVLPETQLEQVLFGSDPSAATRGKFPSIGYLEMAHGGTLFLDEIGEMPINLQAQLLRVSEHSAFQRMSDTEPVLVNVRIIAATTTDLKRAIMTRRFLPDLFERLRTCHLRLPPLRNRLEDIPALAQLFLTRYLNQDRRARIQLSSAALKALTQHKWPGNIRELENAIFRAAIICLQNEIRPNDLFLG
jgi:two-component system, NtrC family, response regulator AtoC